MKMSEGILGYFAVHFLCLFVTITAHSRTSENSFLQRLINSKSSKPVVVFINYGKGNSNFDDLLKKYNKGAAIDDIDERPDKQGYYRNNVYQRGEFVGRGDGNQERDGYIDRDYVGWSEERMGGNYVNDRDEESQEYVERARENDDLYYLAHLLRNLLEDQSSSSSETQEPARQLLRSALRSRCRKVDTCVQECPPKKPACPFNCQKVFDNLSLCPPKPKPKDDACKRKCRGMTLPPRWRS